MLLVLSSGLKYSLYGHYTLEGKWDTTVQRHHSEHKNVWMLHLIFKWLLLVSDQIKEIGG